MIPNGMRVAKYVNEINDNVVQMAEYWGGKIWQKFYTTNMTRLEEQVDENNVQRRTDGLRSEV